MTSCHNQEQYKIQIEYNVEKSNDIATKENEKEVSIISNHDNSQFKEKFIKINNYLIFDHIMEFQENNNNNYLYKNRNDGHYGIYINAFLQNNNNQLHHIHFEHNSIEEQ